MNQLIDCFSALGRPAAPEGSPCLTPEMLLADMDRLGISETFCADYRALEGAPDAGNRLLCETLRGYSRLHPVWVVLPEGTPEFPSPEQLLKDLAASGVTLVRAEPGQQGYSMRGWCSASLWAALETCRIPVLLDIGEQWDALDALLIAYPKLPVILTRMGYRCGRLLFPLLKKHGNLHFEISSYMMNEGVAETVRQFGPEKLLFATDSPRYSPECAIGLLRFAKLPDADFNAVAGHNLKQLTDAAALKLKRILK